jgi:ankyrin repeat protein
MKGRWIVGYAAVLVLSAAAFIMGAGASEVADAVMKGDKAALRALLQRKADVNAPQVDGATALQWAVYRDDVDAADLLIRAGANVKAANRAGVTPLAMASLYGNAQMIDRLLKAGADPKERSPNGETMLMHAARNGSPAAIKLLIGAGADVNATENLRGTTALMWPWSRNIPRPSKRCSTAAPTSARDRARQDFPETIWPCACSPGTSRPRASAALPRRRPDGPIRNSSNTSAKAASTPEGAGSVRAAHNAAPVRLARHAARRRPIRTKTSSSRDWWVRAAEA